MNTLFISAIFVHVIILIDIVFTASSFKNNTTFMDNVGIEDAISDIMSLKSYLPNENNLPKTTIIKSSDDDVTYLLSKLSDEELIKLLNEEPSKDEYNLNDIAKMASGFNSNREVESVKKSEDEEVKNQMYLHDIPDRKIEDPLQQMPFFRLENKKINSDSKSDAQYVAFKKLNALLTSKPQSYQDDSLDDEKRELLFDVLVDQLKTLCCKKTGKQTQKQFDVLKMKERENTEYMFLILNDEIKGSGNNELILVDPDTLKQNSSVLLLGPITTPLTDHQIKIIMSRITMELYKPEYITLLRQLAEGTLGKNNERLMKNFINGAETRRYIKPHRCNHQSKLAKVYGGPKWLICTGYINLNTPSLYD